MNNKTLVAVWLIVDILLLIGCVFAVAVWFETAIKLKNPCEVCVEESPEIAPCIINKFFSLFQNAIQKNKINFSGP